MQDLVKHRIVIYPKDVSRITGLSLRTSWNLISRIKKKYNKKKGQYMTVQEFCEYTGIKEDSVLPFLT